MQTIFLATDKSSGEAWMYNKRPISCAGDFCAGDSIRCRKWFFQNDAPPPGECREYQLVPVGEADDKDARIAEIEAKLAESSPGVMPECVAKLVEVTKHAETSWREFKKASVAVEAYYAPPEGYEWQPVDANRPITAADVGRKVAHRNGGMDFIKTFTDGRKHPVTVGCEEFTVGGGMHQHVDSPFDITHVLRPIAPKFVFTGEPGRYRTDAGKCCDVFQHTKKLLGIIDDRDCVWVNSDGTFPGGRITGRVGE